jgi:phage terminase large subunit-like protein
LSVPRQNGKNALLEMRELYGMLVLGERILHTAHEVKTAAKAFRRLLYFFDNPRKFPKLHARTTTVRKANGQEAIFLDNGGSFELGARSKGAGRGFSVDVVVMDEAQELDEYALAALLPTISVSPNPQTIFTGTPPSPNMSGDIFTKTRNLGLEGNDPRLCWMEWSCENSADPDDPNSVAQANPALGIRLMMETVLNERASFSDDATVGRERLGIWDSLAGYRVISAASWAVCADANLMDSGKDCAFAVDTAPNHSRTTIVASGWTVDGLPFVDVVESRDGEPDWAVHKLLELERHTPRAVVVDGASAANCLIDPLRRAGVTVTVTKANQMSQACGGLYNDVQSARLRHMDQPVLNNSLSVARKRVIGDGGWGWSRKDSDSDITAIVGATLALWGLESTEIEERPKKRSGKAMFV